MFYLTLTINLKEEEIVDVPGKDGNASMPEQVKRPNPWRRKMILFTIIQNHRSLLCIHVIPSSSMLTF
jgi:hypothetical protein